MSLSTNNVISTIGYVKIFFGQRIMVKLGGTSLEDDAVLIAICKDLAPIQAVGIKPILFYGGVSAINKELKASNIESKHIDGQRVTPPEMMKIF